MSLLDFDAAPRRYGVMGNPISHSQSPRIHTLFAAQSGQRIDYQAILVEPGGLAQAMGNFQAQGGHGLNITVPFKQDAWRLVDTRSERAELAGAVNTVRFEADGRLFGDNTDGVGLVRDLERQAGFAIAGRRLLLLGAGGAVRGVLGPLLAAAPAAIHIANRTASRAQALALQFAHPDVALSGGGYPELAALDPFDLIINGTAASLQGELPPLPTHLCLATSALYDMMYGARPTPFLAWGEQQGIAYRRDGLGMLVEQAALSYQLWHGVAPDTLPVIAQLRAALAA